MGHSERVQKDLEAAGTVVTENMVMHSTATTSTHTHSPQETPLLKRRHVKHVWKSLQITGSM